MDDTAFGIIEIPVGPVAGQGQKVTLVAQPVDTSR